CCDDSSRFFRVRPTVDEGWRGGSCVHVHRNYLMEHKTYDKSGYGIPVLTYEEMAGMLLGYDPWQLGLQLHQVQCERLMDKIGIAYNSDEKYKGISGKVLPNPDKPTVLKV
ncbi:MAG: hypothetical protein RR356_08160, partial [Bacteroidales bacterium]